MNLVTGVTGFLGGHLVAKIVESGRQVRALVRPASDTTRATTLPVEKTVGDLADRASLERACEAIEVVHHAAAKASDCGPWAPFRRDTIEGARNLAHAARWYLGQREVNR